MKFSLRSLAGWGWPKAESAEVQQAQFEAHARLVPLMYFILLCNASVLAYTFLGKAPDALTHYPTAIFGLVCLWRVHAWRRRGPEAAAQQLAMTRFLSAAMAVVLALWAFLLFPYGDAFDQSHVAFFLAFTMVSSMLCLVHAWPAPLLVALFAGIPFVVFFGRTGEEVFIAEAFDVVLVVTAAVLILRIQFGHHARMVDARAEASRREQEQFRLLRMIEDLPFAVITIEPESFRINYLNAAALALMGKIEHLLPVRANALLGTCIDVFHRNPAHQRRILADPTLLPHVARLEIGGEILQFTVSAINDREGRYIGPMLALALITQQVQAERRILHLAHHDPLTGLLNRRTFGEQLDETLARGGEPVSVLTIDLDGFKTVNDTLGHRVGDLLLAQVAERLRQRLEPGAVAVARLGGDEFAAVLPGDAIGPLEQVAHGLVGALSAPFVLPGDRVVRIAASVGIATSPRHGTDAETLLSRADIALHAAKAAGRGAVRRFSGDMLSRIQERVALEARLRAVLDSGQGLFVFYQPIHDLASGRVTAREALIRWHEPGRGWVSPAEFVPVAEASGLIDRLGRFVLQQACDEAAAWDDGARVAVNVSAAQLGKGTLLPAVREALGRSGLPAARLEIEVTETALLSSSTDTTSELNALRAMGVRIALDDFGTGYSSLAHLRSFSFDKIKIDGSFVREAVVREDCAAVVRAVAELGRRLGVTTVAEGVETQAHLDCARAEGCAEVQGYFLGRPAPGPRDAPAVHALMQTPADPGLQPAATTADVAGA